MSRTTTVEEPEPTVASEGAEQVQSDEAAADSDAGGADSEVEADDVPSSASALVAGPSAEAEPDADGSDDADNPL